MIQKMHLPFILLISEHKQFGWKLSVHLVEKQPGDSFVLRGIPNIREEIAKGRSEPEIALMKAVDEVSDEALLKAYSKELDKTKIPQTTIDHLIRPRMERNCSKILLCAQESHTPVYFRSGIKEKSFSELNRLEILPEASHCLFNFIKDADGLRYFISLTYQENEISLQQARAIVLSEEPCIVLLDNKIHHVQNIEAKKLKPFFTKTHIHVPSTTEKEYIRKFVLKTIPKYEVKIEGIEMLEKTPRLQAVLVLEQDFYQRLCLSLFFQYDDRRFPPTSQKKKMIVSVEEREGTEVICRYERDIEWENRMVEYLIQLDLQPSGENRFYCQQHSGILQNHGLIAWLNQHIDDLKAFQIEQQTSYSYYNGTVFLASRINEKIDWFDMEIEVVLEDFRIPFSRFRKHILSGNPEYILPNGSVFILPEEWFSRYQEMLLHGETTEQGIRMKKIHWNLLPELPELMPEQQNLMDAFRQTPLELPMPSEHLDTILRPYQKQGFYWLHHLHKLRFGACLADDMGLGKTLQTIALLESVYADEQEKQPASLVVVPTSLLHNWKNELIKFAPQLKVHIHSGAKRLKSNEMGQLFKRYQIIITSYGVVRSDIEYLSHYEFLYLILDESQYIKNPDSMSYQSVNQLQSFHRIALTGTPIENSLTDLWAQFNFLNPGLLGSLSFFKEQYIQKITKEMNPQAEASLQKLIRPFLLRRTKEEVAPDLPPLSQEIVFCDMTEAQEEIYEKEKNNIRNQLLANEERFVKNKFIALQSLMRLRLLSNHPRLAMPDYTGDSGKFDQILLYFESIQAGGHKVLIFSSFVKHLKLLAQAFEDRAWKYALLTGKTQNREAEINRFNTQDDVNCFFISLKAGGTGLNLTAADYVFIIDPWWNPASEMQALSRSHRIGQQKSVMVYRFISTQSIEEKIRLLQDGKNRLAETFVAGNNPLDDLGMEAIMDLL
ncbi:MAG: DEAD/DEAH box helicase [Candidatus Symbiothrix sp.]|jgi:hypothetical protein|nr:DEAD/DEAH box helicase [Candidatus Symbiothrix sp.]